MVTQLIHERIFILLAVSCFITFSNISAQELYDFEGPVDPHFESHQLIEPEHANPMINGSAFQGLPPDAMIPVHEAIAITEATVAEAIEEFKANLPTPSVSFEHIIADDFDGAYFRSPDEIGDFCSGALSYSFFNIPGVLFSINYNEKPNVEVTKGKVVGGYATSGCPKEVKWTKKFASTSQPQSAANCKDAQDSAIGSCEDKIQDKADALLDPENGNGLCPSLCAEKAKKAAKCTGDIIEPTSFDASGVCGAVDGNGDPSDFNIAQWFGFNFDADPNSRTEVPDSARIPQNNADGTPIRKPKESKRPKPRQPQTKRSGEGTGISSDTDSRSWCTESNGTFTGYAAPDPDSAQVTIKCKCKEVGAEGEGAAAGGE